MYMFQLTILSTVLPCHKNKAESEHILEGKMGYTVTESFHQDDLVWAVSLMKMQYENAKYSKIGCFKYFLLLC